MRSLVMTSNLGLSKPERRESADLAEALADGFQNLDERWETEDPTTITLGEAADPGESLNVARADHSHGTNSGAFDGDDGHSHNGNAGEGPELSLPAASQTLGANNLLLGGASANTAGQLTDAYVAAANKDGVAGTASLRTLGTGAQQAAAGNHSHAATSEFTTETTTEDTGSASFVTLMTDDITVAEGSHILVMFHGLFDNDVAAHRTEVGVQLGTAATIAKTQATSPAANDQQAVSFVHRFDSNTAGTYTINARWRSVDGSSSHASLHRSLFLQEIRV